MSGPTRHDISTAQREIRKDARLERWLLLQAAIALIVVIGVVVLRELVLR